MSGDATESADEKWMRISSVVGEIFDGTYSVNGKARINVQTFDSDLSIVFSSSVKSYRELVFLIAIARIDDVSFKASESLYKCNPRAMFEKAMRPQFAVRKIPYGQSPALNIAKATEAIGPAWAAQRRQKEAAQAVLNLVEAIDSLSAPDLVVLAHEIARRFIELASYVESHKYEGSSVVELPRLSDMIRKLIVRAPDGGNTAQRIAGLALRTLHENSTHSIDGVEDSASTTNATSKKPGDIAISDDAGRLLMVFEITTKSFGEQRIDECSQSLSAYLKDSQDDIDSVTVLCMPENVPAEVRLGELGSSVVLGEANDGSFNYEFVDLLGWIDAMLASMPKGHRMRFFEALSEYVNHFQTSGSVKLEFLRLLAT